MKTFRNIMAVCTGLMVIAGCAKPYDPALDTPGNLLVVEGLLTNEQYLSSVKLSRSFPFGQLVYNTPESGALVWVTDQDDQDLFMQEAGEGMYIPSGWTAEVGNTYTLHIETADGNTYRSVPQTMQGFVTVDSIYGVKSTHQVMETNLDGGTYIRDIRGTDVFVDITGNPGALPRYRLEVTLVVLYFWEVSGASSVSYYGWHKIFSPGKLQVNSSEFEAGTDTIKNHLVAFAGEDRKSNRLDNNEYLQYHGLIIRQFSLTPEALTFYRAMKDQLDSEGRIFDPIAVQLMGNMLCVSDPEQPVLGLFDVSATKTDSWMLLSPPWKIEKTIVKVPSLENIPNSGYTVDEFPEFWPVMK